MAEFGEMDERVLLWVTIRKEHGGKAIGEGVTNEMPFNC